MPPIHVPTIAAAFWLDAPKGFMEGVSAWRDLGRGKAGRRELCLKIVEVDGIWEGTELWKAPPPPPIPAPRLVLERNTARNFWDAISEWLGK